MADESYTFRLEQRESLVLMIMALVAVLLFVGTSFAVRLYRDKQKSLADDWFARGKAAMAQGDANNSIADFRNALAYSDNSEYRRQLAEALVAAGRRAEARAYLLNLREDEPADAVVNLDLARLSAADGNVREALQFYHDAIYGVWREQDPTIARRNVRFELAEYLLSRGDEQAAQADLVELAANLPKDAALHTRVADMLIRAGDVNTAVAEYRHAIEADAQYLPALKGLGSATYAAGDYEQARNILERAVHMDGNDAEARQMLQVADLALALNPFERRLSIAERARRAAQDFNLTLNRLQACAGRSGIDLHSAASSTPPASDLKTVFDRAQQFGRVNTRTLVIDPDLVYPVMEWIATAQDETTRVCGPPSGPDLALTLIARRTRQ